MKNLKNYMENNDFINSIEATFAIIIMAMVITFALAFNTVWQFIILQIIIITIMYVLCYLYGYHQTRSMVFMPGAGIVISINNIIFMVSQHGKNFNIRSKEDLHYIRKYSSVLNYLNFNSNNSLFNEMSFEACLSRSLWQSRINSTHLYNFVEAKNMCYANYKNKQILTLFKSMLDYIYIVYSEKDVDETVERELLELISEYYNTILSIVTEKKEEEEKVNNDIKEQQKTLLIPKINDMKDVLKTIQEEKNKNKKVGL